MHTPKLGWQLKYQNALFAPSPKRRALLEASAALPQSLAFTSVAVNVWRNHAFESLLPIIKPYAAISSVDYRCWLSAYDDSLSFQECAPKADLECLWLDLSRYCIQET